MRILVTGGAGFIGSHLAGYFQSGAEVRVLDDLRSGHEHNLNGLKMEFVKGSILDRDLVRKTLAGVDFVFHLAAMVSVPESMHKPIECAEINVKGLLIVLEESARAGVRKLCFISSAAIYGNNPAVPKVETMIPEPASPYAITKLDGEYYSGLFTAEGRLETVSLRLFNVFGPRQDPAAAYAAAVPIFTRQALANKPITIYGDGTQTRDFIEVNDVVRACAFAATTPEITGVFNVGHGVGTTINQIARMIIDASGSKSEIRYEPARPGDVKQSLASVDKFQRAGFRPSGILANGIMTMVRSLRSP